MTLHLIKLAVGCASIEALRERQAEMLRTRPPLRHRTRMFPKRAPEIVDGGSIFWVIGGAALVRQRIHDIVEDATDDGTRCAGIVLDPTLVTVAPRATKPFQGWRYLAAAEAPADLMRGQEAAGEGALPVRLREELRALCLL